MTFKRDCRLGIDDFLLWPQPFIDEHCHLAAIPRPPETLDPKNSTHILYSSAVDDEHFVLHHGGTLAGLGKLSKSTLEQLKLVAENLQSKADKYWSDDSFPKKIPIFANILAVVKLYLDAFESIPMTRRQVHFAFAELQRFMLEFIGAYQYMYIYQPRIANLTELASKPYHTVGAFVTSLTDCDALFRAGIRVWLIRPAKWAGSVRVDSLVQLQDPKDHLCLDSAYHNYRVFFNGSPSNPQKYKVFSQYSRHFFSFGDPFNTGPTSEPSVSTSSTNQPLALSNVGRSKPAVRPKDNRRPAPCKSRLIVVSFSVQHDTSDRKPPPGNSNRNKFAEPDSSLMPPAIPAWRSALSHVVADPERVVYEITAADAGYAFPDPGLFVSVTIAERQATYFANWVKYREALIYRLAFSSSASTSSNKIWRALLKLPLNHNPTAPPKRDVSEKTSRSQKQHDIVYSLLESCFNVDHEVTLNPVPLLDINWQGQTLLSTCIPPVQMAQEILWEIYELNFRFEFKALDHRAHIPVGGVNGPPRDQLILACFPGQTSFPVAPITSAHEGLGAIKWRARRCSIIAMRTVMQTWRGFNGAQFHITKGVDDLSE